MEKVDVMKKLFDMQHYTMNESNLNNQIVQQMFAKGEGDILFRNVEFVISKSPDIDSQIITKIKEIIPDAKAWMPYEERAVYIIGTRHQIQVFISVSITADDDVSSVDIKIHSDLETATLLQTTLNQSFRNETLPAIKWWYIGERGPTTREYYLPKNDTKIYAEFYPDLGDPAKYLAEYMASDEAILLIAGPPGTGKTTLLRHLIHDYKLSAHVIYDERIMEQDSPFQQFLFGQRRASYPGDDDIGGDIMIIEDADAILTSRERDNNKLMSRFLNISDGLIKLPNKKLIFTTNISDFQTIDSALLRPGRCFGLMHTRALNLGEAQAAARVANLPIPTEKKEYSLAELFNQGNRLQVRTIGFGARH